MLEGPLHLLNVVSTAANIDFRVLRVLHTQSVTRPFIVTVPAPGTLLEVLSALSDGEADVLVVELRAVELQEVDEVLTQVHVIRAATFVLSLQIARHHHR